MKIAKVEPIVIDMPLEQPVRTSFGEMNRRTNVLVRIEADTGEYGIGEIWNNFPAWGAYEKIATLEYGVAPLLIGEDPLDIAGINRKLHQALSVLGRQWGAVGPIYHSISGVDMALWDLSGKHWRMPVYQLLGGKRREAIGVYASGLGPRLSEDMVIRQLETGVSAFKLKVGHDRELNVRNLARLREIIGPDDRLMIDANQAWDRGSAIAHLRLYEPYRLEWVEEPLRCDDYEGMRQLREQTGIPVAAGENIYGSDQARKALEQRALDILQPDMSKNGGLTEALAAAGAAGDYGAPCVPHFLGGAVCLAASMHFCAGVAIETMLELDANPNPFREKLFAEPFVIRGGKLKVPDRPGLGFELDPEFVEHYRVNIHTS